jgi:UDP-3-O-[3-hydroxymyristoyl] glucosamine N-acyltransferase
MQLSGAMMLRRQATFLSGFFIATFASDFQAAAQTFQSVPIGTPVEIGRPVDIGRPVNIGRPVAIGQPVQIGRSVNVGTPVQVGRPVPLGQPVQVGRPANIGSAANIGRPTIVGSPAIIGAPAAAGASVQIGRPIGIGSAVPLGRAAPAGEAAAIGHGIAVGTASTIGIPMSGGRPVSVGTSTGIGTPAAVGSAAAIGNPTNIGRAAPIGSAAQIGVGSQIGTSSPIGQPATVNPYAAVLGKSDPSGTPNAGAQSSANPFSSVLAKESQERSGNFPSVKLSDLPQTGIDAEPVPTNGGTRAPLQSSAMPAAGSSGIAGSTPAMIGTPFVSNSAPSAKNPFSSVLAPTTQSSTPTFSIVMATVNGHAYMPISQMSPNNYTGGTFKSDSEQACLATVYAMAERGTKGDNSIPINKFYNTSEGALLPNNMTRGPLTDNLTSLQYGPQLLMIRGTASTGSGAQEAHYMLGTYVNDVQGKKEIVANDPYSGVQVTIDANTGRVVNPPAGYANINFTADAFRTLTVN